MATLQVYLRWFRSSGEIIEWYYPSTDQRLARKRLERKQRILSVIAPNDRCEIGCRSHNPHTYNHP